MAPWFDQNWTMDDGRTEEAAVWSSDNWQLRASNFFLDGALSPALPSDHVHTRGGDSWENNVEESEKS